jgi:hypothetical protein
MQVHPYVADVQSQLTAAAALGDEATMRTAEVLAAAAEPAIRLAVLAAVSAAADEITSALLDAPGAPAVVVRLDGDDLRVEVRPGVPVEPYVEPPPPGDDVDASARISLRLSESLKGRIEAAARAGRVSVNTWLVRAAGSALSAPDGERPRASGGSGHRMTGWINR